MVFSSLVFLFVFLPVTLLAYYAVPMRHRNLVALLSSIFFYAWGAPRLVFLLLASSAVDYAVSRRLEPSDSAPPGRRKIWLALGILVNLSALLYFKYANFFVAELGHLLGLFGMDAPHWTAVVLPIGISFFTFQKISYLVDVYRGWAKPARSLSDYVLYVILFPQLIAGPIVRYHDVAMQLISREHSPEKFLSGVWRFCRGLAKKVLVANVMGQVADRAFGAAGGELPMAYAWVGIVCYAFQIYFDFSGYSDMAIGLGRMLGFEFLENFNCPYIARTITEFWRRWHISLSNWMREYLYVPLGGNRGSRFRTYANLWIVFLFSGFWHGAAWNFVVWGAFHGLFISIDKLAGLKRLARVPGVIAIPVTFVIVLFSWVLFRAPDLAYAAAYIRSMVDPASIARAAPMTWPAFIDAHGWTVLVIAAVLSFAPAFAPPAVSIAARFNTPTRRPYLLLAQYAVSGILLVLSAAALSASTFNPFIYFRF